VPNHVVDAPVELRHQQPHLGRPCGRLCDQMQDAGVELLGPAVIGKLSTGNLSPALGDPCHGCWHVPPALDEQPRHGLTEQLGVSGVTSSARRSASSTFGRRRDTSRTCFASRFGEGGASKVDAREGPHRSRVMVTGVIGVRFTGVIGVGFVIEWVT
jgi:hypothetical protein